MGCVELHGDGDRKWQRVRAEGGGGGEGSWPFLMLFADVWKETKWVNWFSFELVVCCSSQLLFLQRSSVAAQELVGLAVNKMFFTPPA